MYPVSDRAGMNPVNSSKKQEKLLRYNRDQKLAVIISTLIGLKKYQQNAQKK